MKPAFFQGPLDNGVNADASSTKQRRSPHLCGAPGEARVPGAPVHQHYVALLELAQLFQEVAH